MLNIDLALLVSSFLSMSWRSEAMNYLSIYYFFCMLVLLITSIS